MEVMVLPLGNVKLPAGRQVTATGQACVRLHRPSPCSRKGSEDGSPASQERPSQWGEASAALSVNKGLNKAFWEPLAAGGMEGGGGKG